MSREEIAIRGVVARGSWWFLGTIFVIWAFFPKSNQQNSLGEQVFKLVFAGIIVGGAMFCKDWYEDERFKRIRANKLPRQSE